MCRVITVDNFFQPHQSETLVFSLWVCGGKEWTADSFTLVPLPDLCYSHRQCSVETSTVGKSQYYLVLSWRQFGPPALSESWGLSRLRRPLLESPSFLPLWFSEEVQWGAMAQTCLKRPCTVRSFPGNWCAHERWRTSALEEQAANFSCKRPDGKYLATTQLCLCSLKIPPYSTERIELGCVPVKLYFWTQNFEFHILVSRSRIILWVWFFFTIISKCKKACWIHRPCGEPSWAHGPQLADVCSRTCVLQLQITCGAFFFF